MASIFKSKFDNVLKSISTLISGENSEPEQKDEFTRQCEDIDSQISGLKARTHEMYADIGMIAIEKYGAEDFGAIGENYKELQTQ